MPRTPSDMSTGVKRIRPGHRRMQVPATHADANCYSKTSNKASPKKPSSLSWFPFARRRAHANLTDKSRLWTAGLQAIPKLRLLTLLLYSHPLWVLLRRRQTAVNEKSRFLWWKSFALKKTREEVPECERIR